jgi:isoleucyl-tRNA synthetase
VVGSRAELGALAGRDLSGLDPHRPFVDEITVACPSTGDGSGQPCGRLATRIPEVADAWFDSGSMPFAQWGYPHLPGSRERFEQAYPADFICEAIDQTRGWFYTLMAVGTLAFDRSSYENVLCLGHILAEDGRKMSKHLGNILEPIPLMEQHGADALRWFMAAAGSPWLPRRVGHAALQEVVRKTLLTYWNTVAFQSLYARTAGWSPAGSDAPAAAERPLVDRWALSSLHRTTSEVGAALEGFDSQRAGALLAGFVDDLSNWYVRRSRRRFWQGDPAALATLHECLEAVTRLMAPIVPFITERVWQDLVLPVTPGAPASVHLASWPVAEEELVDGALEDQMALVRRLVELGRAARAESRMRNRQPLGRALVGAAGWADLPPELRTQIAEELNVVELAPLSEAGGDLVDVSVKGNFRVLGRRFAKDTPTVAQAIAACDAAALAGELRERGSAQVQVDGTRVVVQPDDVIVNETPRQGWAVAAESGETVALDLTLTPALRRAGIAREVTRLVQEARKSSGLDVSDRIALWWEAEGELAEALTEQAGVVAAEVLATQFVQGTPAPADDADRPVEHAAGDLGLRFWLVRAPVSPDAL